MNINQQREAAIKECLAKLGEFYDHIQILATNEEEGKTGRCFSGSGNWFARLGMAHEFINEDMVNENAKKIGQAIHPDDDE